MRKLFVSLFFFMVCGLANAQTPPNPVPPVVGPVVVLPNPPTPTPAPAPAGTPFVLNPGVLYVIPSTGPVVIADSPKGIVKITNETGPMKMWGVFSNGTGMSESRTYTQPNLYIVECASQGSCELLIIPSLNPNAIIRQLITSTGGPAPAPVPNPVPVPVPPADPMTQKLQSALSGDNAPAGTAAILAAVYRNTAKVISQDPSVTTYGQLFVRVSADQDIKVSPSKITGTRELLAQIFLNAFGTSQIAPLDRDLVASTFNSVASKLETLK